MIVDSLPHEDAVGWAQRIQATAATSLRQEELLKAQGEVERLSDLRARMEGMSKRYSSGKTRLSTTNALSSSAGTNSPMMTTGSTAKPSLSLPLSSSASGVASSASVFAMSPEARMALGLSFSPSSSSFNPALRPPGSPSLATAAAQAARKLDLAEASSSAPQVTAAATYAATSVEK